MTLLALLLKDARAQWEAFPADHPLKQRVDGHHEFMMAIHEEYKKQHGVERWEREVMQPGGGASALHISAWAGLVTKFLGRALEKGII